MRNMKPARTIALSFVLLTIVVLPASIFFATAYGQSTSPNLEGTVWEGTTDFQFDNGDILRIKFTYLFSKNGKVDVVYLNHVIGIERKWKLNPRTGINEWDIEYDSLKGTFVLNGVCAYQLQGKSIQIKCSTGDINGVIHGDSMEGEIASRIKGVNGKKERWIVGRTPDSSSSSRPSSSSRTGNSSHPNVVRNADGTLRPANGYRWVNSKVPNDFRVELMPGLVEFEPGKVRPAKGYRWVNEGDPKDFRVERIP